MNEANERLRLRFSKTGRAVYISHLDLMRTMQRAFQRSDIALKYSEGFNPHAQMSIALPLSVGTGSLCEVMDFKLRNYISPSEIVFRLNRSLPEGVRALEVYEWETKAKFIKWMDIDGVFEYDSRPGEDAIPGLMELFSREELVIEKKTKGGIGMSDIAPAIRSIMFDKCVSGVSLKAVISAQEPTLNPEHLVTAVRQHAPELAPDFASFTRTQLYDDSMSVFR